MFDSSNDLLFSVHGGGDAGGGVAGMVASILSFMETWVALSPADWLAHVLPGISQMENIHPLLVHFPIALLSVFFLLEIVGTAMAKPDWRQAAGWFLYAGALFAGLTMLAGLSAAGSVAHGDNVHEVMEHHEHLGISVFLLATVLAVWRWFAKNPLSGPANTLYLIFASILVGLLILTADLGGYMVYHYGVAVQAMAESNQQAAQHHAHEQPASPVWLEQPVHDAPHDHHGHMH